MEIGLKLRKEDIFRGIMVQDILVKKIVIWGLFMKLVIIYFVISDKSVEIFYNDI